MLVYITYFVQILLIVHVLKTGRNRYWIWILLFLPLIGGVAYLVIEILPELTGSISGQKALRNVRSKLDPGGQIRGHSAAWEQSPNADNARRYAAALLEGGKLSDAEAVLEQAMSGFFRTEPNLMLLQAQARYGAEKPQEAVDILEALQEANPEFRSAAGHLLFARALQAAGQTARALEEYRAVAGYYPGAEARYRLAAALQEAGQSTEASDEFTQLIRDAELAPRHFQKSQAQWIKLARSALKEFD